jgi:hypothetical protein
MKTKGKNKHNYVDALENEHLYAVLTKQGRIQILVQSTVKHLRKRGKRGWRLLSTVDNGLPDADFILTETIQRAVQELDSTCATVENNGTKHQSVKERPALSTSSLNSCISWSVKEEKSVI